MAEPIVRKFILDTGDSEQKLKELGDQLKALPNDLPKNKVPGDIVPPEAINNAKSLRGQLKELQAQLANTDPQTDKYRELSQAAGELKDKISDAAQAVGTQAGGAFERVSGSLGLVTSRIASLDFEGAAEGAKLLAQNIGDIKPGDITKGIQGIGSAFVSVGKALLTNPIFLIGAAIAAAVVYADELLTLVDGVTDAELERLNAQKESAAQSKEQLDAISQQENILRLAGKTEREILQTKIAQAQQAIIDQKAVIETLRVQKDQQIAAAERNRDILKGILNFISIPFTALLAGVDLLTEKLFSLGFISEETFAKFGNLRDKFTTTVAELVFDPAQVAKEGEDALKAAEKGLKDLENAQAGFQLSIQAIDKKAADDRKTADDKRAADAKAKREERIKAEQDVSDIVNQLYEENVKEFEEAERQKTKAAEEEAAKRKKAEEDYDAAIKELRAEQDAANLTQDQLDIIAIDNKYLDLREKAIQAGKSTVEVDAAYKQALLDQEIVSADRRLASEKQLQQSKIDFAKQTLDGIATITSAFAGKSEAAAKRAFKIQKAISIAQATISTYESANAIFASTAASPITALFPAAPFVAAGIAVAAGLANVATIASQQFQGSSTPPANNTPPPPSLTGGGGGDNGAQPAQFNPLAAQFVNNRPDQYLPRAYVLAGDVASQQEVRENVADLARVG
jgi:hypothetical protein